ncbi:uncharacterized protein LOC130714470 [Lotus japonicus]|uniref:uncharacterized protein LOC130714470 n=1 Tax=Lotus japonicus TaxID=34305 RepID=UPI00258303A8|nr:uncharacterized protein LOC130714470 [Lotus japonicus]
MNPLQPSAATCDGCGATQDAFLIIHNIRYLASNHRYCTNCVLKHHHGVFCPICFDVFEEGSLLPQLRVMCVRCPNIAHRSCALTSTVAYPTSAPAFLCPTCADPEFAYFQLPDRKSGAVDLQSAKMLVAAARIAAVSMTKAAAAARFDAERRAKEAAVARRKAKEALENLASIVAMEQMGVSAQNAGVRVTN